MRVMKLPTIMLAMLALFALTNHPSLGGNVTSDRDASRVTWAPTARRPATAPTTAPPLSKPNSVPARSMMDAGDSDRNARVVRQEISWSNSLADAKQRAAAQNKVIFWMHILGKLDGAT